MHKPSIYRGKNKLIMHKHKNVSKKKTNKKNTKHTQLKNEKQKTEKQLEERKKPSTKRITLRKMREHDISRANKILQLLPAFIKFYKKLKPEELQAIKYYKGYGSYFQSKLLAQYNTKSTEKQELMFPFRKSEDNLLYMDILGKDAIKNIYNLWLPNSTELDQYIDDSYGIRIKLLNKLDKIYDNPDCPKLTGEEILFRGMRAIPVIKKLKPGDTYIFRNFISTTIDRRVAENYSDGDTIFVLSGLKDIPCIYMSNSKFIGNTDYTTHIQMQNINYDLSELVLPRNLEFEITHIEKRYISDIYYGYYDNINSNNIGKILKKMKKSGLTESDLENEMFSKATFIYATFKQWHPREKIDFANIKKNAKFVLDSNALNSWKPKYDDEDD